MPDIAGEAIDRLITVEAKNRGMPHNVLPPMYEAARKHVGGRPITMVAAEKLKSVLKKGDTVLILTGAGYVPTLIACCIASLARCRFMSLKNVTPIPS